MSIQWTIAAVFLLGEVVFLIFLLLPVISPVRWKQVFNSSPAIFIQQKSYLFFNFFLGVLIILFMDSLREMFKYRQIEDISTLESTKRYSDSEAAREFRAQRNVYITSMSLFLWFIIKRLVVLMYAAANLTEELDFSKAETESIRKQLHTFLMEKKIANEEQQQTKKVSERSGAATLSSADDENVEKSTISRPRSRSRPKVKET